MGKGSKNKPQPRPGFTAWLKTIRGGAVFVAGTAGIISSLVVKNDLVPEQVTWLGAAGALTAMAALIALPMQPRRGLFGIMLVFVALLVTIRAVFVETLEISGQSRLYLVGISLSTDGVDLRQNCLKELNATVLSRGELVRCAGPASIPSLYGWTYYLLTICYVLSYLAFLLIFVIRVGTWFYPAD